MSEFREGQYEVIAETIKAFEGGARNVIIDAPTGAGKTPIAITLARYYTWFYSQSLKEALHAKEGLPYREGMEVAKKMLAPNQAHMITSLKMLQDQYLNDDKLIQIMKGKGNYECHSPAFSSPFTVSCNDMEVQRGHGCGFKGKNGPCEYLAARHTAQMARMTLHNFDSFLNQVSLGGSFIPRRILTIDEAHGADDRLIKVMGFEISNLILSDLGLVTPWSRPDSLDKMDHVKDWLSGYDDQIKVYLETINAEILKLRNKSTGYLSSSEEKKLSVMSKSSSKFEDMRRKMGRFISSCDKVPWAVEMNRNGTISLTPVKSSFFAREALLKYGDFRLFMSATIFDKGKRLISAMNMDPGQTHYIGVPCRFPAVNRPLVKSDVANTGAQHYSGSRMATMAAIERIINHHHGVNGVIHCNSYEMADDIKMSIDSKRLMFHDSSNRDEILKEFAKGKDKILVAVYMREGYDFKDDMARFQVIPRIPYPYPDKRTKMRDDMEKGYYNWLTLIDLIQITGRGTRNNKDHCVTYCLDNRLGSFISKTRYMIPKWFMEAIVSDHVDAVKLEKIVAKVTGASNNNDDEEAFFDI